MAAVVLSQNGWAAGDAGAADIVKLTVPGTDVTFPSGLKRGDAATVLLYVAEQLHARVEAGVTGWCWGYNYRPVRGATSLSNHSSGTAFDWCAPRHPLAKSGTYTAAQIAEIHAILREVDGVVRWGGDYTGRRDEMHYELNASPAQVARVAERLRARQDTIAAPVTLTSTPATTSVPAPAPVPVPVAAPAPVDGPLRHGDHGPAVLAWQEELWRLGFGVGRHDSVFGPAVEGATLDLQRAGHLDADGIVGPGTRDTARRVPDYPKAPGADLPLCGPGGPTGTVREFQARLAARGWQLTVDGQPGPRTSAVVRSFQTDANARGYVVGNADGVGGPATWAALWLAPVTS